MVECRGSHTADAITVTEFNKLVSSLVTYTDSIRNLSLVGEISGLSQGPTGHVYFSLKDAESVIKCTLFKGAASRVKFPLRNGIKVTAFGSASYYIKGGSFGFNIESLAEFGKGEQQIALEKLTAQLLAEGLFDPERKRAIPLYPKTIGVVTSPKGAVIKDIIDTTARRYPVDILLSPATVQGEDAPKSIVHAIELLNEQNVDVIIVGRGGGSAEDLSAFNDESVVRAVSTCNVPVISAVGHATDKSLTDRAADKYAETPTAAAMLATPDREDEMRNLSSLWVRCNRSLGSVVDRMKLRFDSLDKRLSPRNAKDAVAVYSGKLDGLSKRMGTGMNMTMLHCRSRLQTYDVKLNPERLRERLNQQIMTAEDLSATMDRAITAEIDSKRNSLDRLSAKLDGLDPNKVLARGYCLIRDSSGDVVTSADQLFVGTDITVTMRDGSAVAKVKEVRLK